MVALTGVGLESIGERERERERERKREREREREREVFASNMLPYIALLQDINVPLTQLCLLCAISFECLLASAPDTHSRALALSSAIHHAPD